ncbi:381_t:CDS:1, partial [Scutellospora calospora]
MGTHVITSHKPEYFHKQCNNCSSQLEFPIPKNLTTSSQLSVKCYSCQNINSFEIGQDTTIHANGTNSSKPS